MTRCDACKTPHLGYNPAFLCPHCAARRGITLEGVAAKVRLMLWKRVRHSMLLTLAAEARENGQLGLEKLLTSLMHNPHPGPKIPHLWFLSELDALREQDTYLHHIEMARLGMTCGDKAARYRDMEASYGV